MSGEVPYEYVSKRHSKSETPLLFFKGFVLLFTASSLNIFECLFVSRFGP